MSLVNVKDWLEKDGACETGAGAELPPPPQDAKVKAARLANTKDDLPFNCITCLDFLFSLRLGN